MNKNQYFTAKPWTVEAPTLWPDLRPFTQVTSWFIAVFLTLKCADVAGLELRSSSEIIEDFCKRSEEVDRGIAVSPFNGPTSQFIADGLLSNKNFRTAIGITDKQFESAKEYAHIKRRTDPHNRRRGVINTLDAESYGYSLFLEKLFATRQQDQLAGLYISLEGFMALRRDSVARLIGIDGDQQECIAKLANGRYETQASAYHRAAFSDYQQLDEESNKEELKRLRRQLRKVSAGLDRSIVALLNPEQTNALATLLDKSTKVEKSVWRELASTGGLQSIEDGDSP